MKIIIKIEDRKVELILENNNKIVDKFSWREERNLSQKLLVEIDNLLKKNKLKSLDIKNMQVKTDISERFTTVRIAKIVAKTFNFNNKAL